MTVARCRHCGARLEYLRRTFTWVHASPARFPHAPMPDPESIVAE